jgi:Leucine-rich repeat (LRR) protein
MSSSSSSSSSIPTRYSNTFGLFESMNGARKDPFIPNTRSNIPRTSTAPGLARFLNQQNLGSLAEAHTALKRYVTSIPIYTPIKLPRDSTLLQLFEQFPGAINIDVSSKPDITDYEFLEAKDWLKDIKVLNMNGCRQLTDAVFEHLKNLTSLSMGSCRELTNEAFRHLKNLTILNMKLCMQNSITDEAFSHLKNLTRLNMSFCMQITDAAFESLENLKSLDIAGCRQLTDTVFIKTTDKIEPRFKNLTSLNMSGCGRITDAAFPYLKNLTSLNMSTCRQITDAAFPHLKNLTSLNMRGCEQSTITPFAFQYMNDLLECETKRCRPEVIEAAENKINENKMPKPNYNALDGGYRRNKKKSMKRRSKKTRKQRFR